MSVDRYMPFINPDFTPRRELGLPQQRFETQEHLEYANTASCTLLGTSWEDTQSPITFSPSRIRSASLLAEKPKSVERTCLKRLSLASEWDMNILDGPGIAETRWCKSHLIQPHL